MSNIPVGWATTEVGNLLIQIVGGGTPSKAVPAHFDGNIPFMTVKDMTERFPSDTVDHISEEAVQSSATIVVPADTLIVATRMSLGKVVRPRFATAINQDLKALFFATGIDKTFIEHWWRYRSEVIQSLGTGTTVKGIRLDNIRSLTINIPPSNEQKRISDKLDSLLARLDISRKQLNRVPEILRHFRQAVLSAATSGQMTEGWCESKGIDGEWSDAKLGDVAFVTKLAGFEYTKYVSYREGGDLKVIKAENAGKWGFKYTDFSTVYSEEVSTLSRSKLHEGDVLMVFVGAGTGQVARVPAGDNWFLGPNIAMIRTESSKLNPAYLEHFCRSPVGVNTISEFIKSVAQPSLSMKTIRQIQLLLPTIEEQNEIVRRVDNLLALVDRLEARYSAGREQVEQLIPSLLDKAFRGELVPQDPDDEPAEKLLERIQAAKSSELTKPKPKASVRKPITMKITTETVKKTIQQMPQDRFSFEELRQALPADYESLKEAVFELLGESEMLSQFFDTETESIRFKRSQL